MQIINGTSGSGVALYRGQFIDVKWYPHSYNEYAVTVEMPCGATIDIEDYDERFDINYSVSDDGAVFYGVLVLLNDDETPGIIPNEDDLKSILMDNVKPIWEKAAAQEIDPSDLTFAMNIMRSQEMMYRAYNRTGTVEKAAALIRREVFRIP